MCYTKLLIIPTFTTGISSSIKYYILVCICKYERNAVKSSQNRIRFKVMAMRNKVQIKQWSVLYIYSDNSHSARVRSLAFIDFLQAVCYAHDSFVEYFP